MKWRERSEFNRYRWYAGPHDEYYTAMANGVRYEVCSRYENMFARKGAVIWWSHDGCGTNKAWQTKEAAMAWCEKDAAEKKAAKKAAKKAGP